MAKRGWPQWLAVVGLALALAGCGGGGGGAVEAPPAPPPPAPAPDVRIAQGTAGFQTVLAAEQPAPAPPTG